MKALRMLEKSTDFWFIVATSFVFFLLRFPSLFEPLWYGDEGIYQSIGSSLNNGQLLYKEIFDNKPPFLYWLYSFFQSDQFTIRFVSLIFGILSTIMFFFLSRKLFRSRRIPYVITAIFAFLFGLPLFEGNIANAENFMLLPIIASSFFIVSQKRFFIAGLILGLAFFFKIVAVFDFFAFVVFCFIINFDSLKGNTKLRSIVLGFCLPIAFISLFFVANGTFTEFIKATLISNISYVSYGNKIGTFPLLLFIKLVLLGIFTLYIFKERKKLKESTIFTLIWFAFSLFNAFFSQRPYAHYIIVLLPSLSLMIGLIIFDKSYQKTIVTFLLISLTVIAARFGTPRFEKNIYYYQNFISYMKGEKTTTSYQAFFDRHTPVDYEIARFIKPKLGKNDTIFVWGNNAQLYQLTGTIPVTKYIVAYHIKNYKDGILVTKAALEKTKPKFIVIMPHQLFPFSMTEYFNKIRINEASIYERLL